MKEPPVTKVKMINIETEREFDVLFYGLEMHDLCLIPNPYMAALDKRRGLNPEQYTSSPFFVKQIR